MVTTPITPTFLALPHLQPWTVFCWNINLHFQEKNKSTAFLQHMSPDTTESLQAQISVICMMFLTPNQWHRERTPPEARRYFTITGIILRELLSAQSYCKLAGHMSSFFLYMRHICKVPYHLRRSCRPHEQPLLLLTTIHDQHKQARA